MSQEPIITREIAPLPERGTEVHKGDVGRLCIIGGSCGEELMIGAVALAANAALRTGTGLVQMIVPEPIRPYVTMLAPCATCRTLPTSATGLLDATRAFRSNVAAIGPGLGQSLDADTVAEFVSHFPGPVVVDADALNRLAAHPACPTFPPERVVLTPHPGEALRLLSGKGIDERMPESDAARRELALRLQEAYGGTIVLKGHRTVVTNGHRLYVNETGNAGMATGGAGDVLTGMIAALVGQGMDAFEAPILGTYLHGLAGDFAAGELGRWSLTALDLIEFLPEAFCEYDVTEGE